MNSQDFLWDFLGLKLHQLISTSFAFCLNLSPSVWKPISGISCRIELLDQVDTLTVQWPDISTQNIYAKMMTSLSYDVTFDRPACSNVTLADQGKPQASQSQLKGLNFLRFLDSGTRSWTSSCGSCKPQFQIQFETSVSVSIHSVAVNPLCTRFCRPFSTITIACFTVPYTVRQLICCVLQVKISIFSLFSVLLWIKTFEIYLFLVDCYFHVYFSHVESTIIISSHFKKINKSPCVWVICLILTK